MISRKYILHYVGGRIYATSDAVSFADAISRASVHGLSPDHLLRGERLLGTKMTTIVVEGDAPAGRRVFPADETPEVGP